MTGDDALRTIFVQGLQAVHAADEQSRVTADDIAKAASDPRLKDALRAGTQIAQRQAQRLAQVFQQAGAAPSDIRNEAIEGIAEAAQHIRESNHDPKARDLGIIAASQIALHYYIASYGTLRAYADALGMSDAATTLDGMLAEMKRQDEKHTELAAAVLKD